MIGLFRYLIVLAGVTVGLTLITGLRHLVKKTCFFRHRNKRFIAMDLNGQPNAQGVMVPRCRCYRDPNYQTYTDHHRFRMRWFCDACDAMGEHCWDKTGEWKLEMGKIVPDEKRWAQRK
jgi:hypothetical protein